MRTARIAAFLTLVPCTVLAQVFGASGGELVVNTYTTGLQGGGAVAVSDAGNFIVLWSGDGPDGQEIYARRFSFNMPLGAQFRVNVISSGGPGSPTVGSDAAGDVVMVWGSDDADQKGVFARRMTSAGAFSGVDFAVNTTTTGYQSYSTVASDPSGNFVVVWTSPGADFVPDVVARRYTAAGSPIGGEFRVNTYSTGAQERPAVSRSSTGFVVVWKSGDQPGYGSSGIYGQRYDATGVPRGTEFFVNPVNANGATNPDVAMDGSGNFVVVWQAATGGLHDVFARRYDPNANPVGSEFRVNTATTDSQTYPAIAMASAGSFVVTWQSGSLYGGVPGIFARRFHADATPLGADFRVNTTETGALFNGSVASDPSGDFVVTWTQGQLGTQDVRLRRYCVNLAGDVNGSGVIDVADVFYLINYLFASGPSPLSDADANGDGSVDVADVFYLINDLFAGGPAPACTLPA